MKAAAIHRVGIYARVSTSEQKENTSFDSQIKACREWAAQQGYSVVEDAVVEEDASGARLHRPGMDLLLDIAAKKGIDAVLLAKVDRLARGRLVDALLEATLAESGVSVLYVGRDSTTKEGRLLINIEKDFAEWERERILERTSEGKFNVAKSGRVMGSGLVPFGYRYVKIVKLNHSIIDGGYYETVPDEAVWVIKIFQWVAVEGCSLHEVARRLNAQAVPTRNGGTWTPATIRYIIRNRTYAGTYVWNRTESVMPAKRRVDSPKSERTAQRVRDESEWITSPCPAIIGGDLFEAAQRQLQVNRDRSPRNCHTFYMLRGMLRCAECGERLMGHKISSGGGKYSNRYYDCRGRVKNAHVSPADKCETPHHNADRLERKLWAKVERALTDAAFLRKLVEARVTEWEDEVSQERKELAVIEVAIAKAEVEDNRLVEAYKEGVLTLSELKQHRAVTQKQRESLEAERARMRERIKASKAAEGTLEALERFIAAAQRGLPKLADDAKREFLLTMDIRAYVDAKGEISGDGWITEGLLAQLERQDEQDQQDQSVQPEPLHLSIKPTPA